MDPLCTTKKSSMEGPSRQFTKGAKRLLQCSHSQRCLHRSQETVSAQEGLYLHQPQRSAATYREEMEDYLEVMEAA